MIIKKAIIKSFGGLKDKEIDFKKGVNLIYGENEKGKSTIQNFIRAWLFGFSNTRGVKNNLRKKYLPFSGEKMRGELIVSFEERDYIIKRSFGNTKKEDKSIVLDYLTGELVKEVSSEAPGEYFLSVNGNTFLKTLYIPQLGVSISKDKDEEIMEKIISLFGCGEGEVSVDKGISKLKEKRKEITTNRKSGELDILKERYNYVIEERYESYNIVENNLSKEEELLKSKEKRKKLREDIDNLKLYKKHNKKMELQKEYKEISNYLKKREVLRREEEELKESLNIKEGIIDNEFIDELGNENKDYLALLDFKYEKEEELENLKKELENLKGNLENYEVFNSLDSDIKEKLIFLSARQENLKEKIAKGNSLEKSIKDESLRLSQKEKFLGDILKLEKDKDYILNLFSLYEEKLHLLREEVTKNPYSEEVKEEKENLIKKKKKFYLSTSFGAGLLILNLFLFKGIIFYILSGATLVFSGIKIIKIDKDLRLVSKKVDDLKYVQKLTEEIEEIENILKGYMNVLDISNFENLLRSIKSLESFLDYKEKITIILEERKSSLREIDIKSYREEYFKNSKIINSIMNISRSDNIEDVYKKLDNFNNSKKEITTLELQIKSKEEEIDRLNYELSKKEEKIKNDLNNIGLIEVNLIDLDVYLNQLREKINKKNQLESRLEGINETYKLLLKDRNIEEIEEELKDVLTLESHFNYKNEEEIEEEMSLKSNLLIEIEKKIKDLENSIKSSFLGRRDITSIEEDLGKIVSRIEFLEMRLKGIDLAIETLEKSGREIKDNFGPTLNKEICDNFKKLTGDKYSEVKLSDDYQMLVRDKNEVFSSEYLSNGANDQLYLALRLAFIDIIFKNEKFPVILDDTFIQYDDNRRKLALEYIINKGFAQLIILTCQNIEGKILNSLNYEFNKIEI